MRQLLAAHRPVRATADHRYISHSCVLLACRKSIGIENSFGGFGEP
jgi:hypothetical protein